MTLASPTLISAMSGLRRQSQDLAAVVAGLSFRGWLLAAVVAALTLIVIAIPTEIIANPFFRRMTEVRVQDYVFWALTGVLVGLIAGTYATGGSPVAQGRILSGGFLSYLAVGCPVCNKVVVALIGTSGALSFFAPAQLFIGLASVALLGVTLQLRVRALTQSCPLPVRGSPEGTDLSLAEGDVMRDDSRGRWLLD